MEELIDRRRFVACAGTAAALGAAGCLGSGEQSTDGAENSGGDANENSDDSETQRQPADFEFPPGADERGVVTETLVAGSRQVLDNQGRYRAVQTHTLAVADSRTEEIEITYDAGEHAVSEHQSRNAVEFDRWVTPERTVGRSTDARVDRTGLWAADTAETDTYPGSFNRYPFEKAAVPALLRNASFDFEAVVTEDEQPYARYVGDLSRSEQLEVRPYESARLNYRIESVSEGDVTMLLAESGAIRALEYEFAGEAVQLTHDGRGVVDFEVSSSIQFECDDLDPLATPEWIDAADSDDIRTFDVTETSLGRTYTLDSGPSLPGSVSLAYTEFYLMAQFGEDRYIDRHIPRHEFDTSGRVLAGFDDGLEFHSRSISGRNALEEADRIEMSVYVYTPGDGRTMVFHEERDP